MFFFVVETPATGFAVNALEGNSSLILGSFTTVQPCFDTYNFFYQLLTAHWINKTDFI